MKLITIDARLLFFIALFNTLINFLVFKWLGY